MNKPSWLFDASAADVNGDGVINAADIVEMVNAKNNKASDKFVLKYADIDGDKKITQSDIDAVVKIILKNMHPPPYQLEPGIFSYSNRSFDAMWI